ncbi:hypothetical protein Tco_0240507 [Tanacetum coccineum]
MRRRSWRGNKPRLFSFSWTHCVPSYKQLEVFFIIDREVAVLLPQSMRLDVLKFSGDDPDRWIFAITKYFSFLNILADQRLGIVGFNLEGTVAKWFRWMSRNGLITTWDRVTDIPDSLLISFYISGLKLHLQRELLVLKPTTLGNAFLLARNTKARLDDQAAPVAGTSAKTFGSNGGDDSFRSDDTNRGSKDMSASYGDGSAVPGGRRITGGSHVEWMPDSQSTYSLYHLEGKVIFEGVENVTPWAVDDGRRKRVKC